MPDSALIRALALAALLTACTLAAESDAAEPDDWSGYEPEYSIGAGKAEWWIRYPDQNVNADQSVSHPLWVMDSLKEGPVLILDHTKRCRPCIKQLSAVENVLVNYSGWNVTYYDLDAEGSERRAQDVLEIYSPTGGSTNHVPLTVILTLVRDDSGELKVAWHSMSGHPVDSDRNSLGELVVGTYLRDAIYYHRENAGSASDDNPLFGGLRTSERMERLRDSRRMLQSLLGFDEL